MLSIVLAVGLQLYKGTQVPACINADEAESCAKSHRKRDIVISDYEEGRTLNVTGTPTYFVNGKQVATGFDTLSAAIEAELKGPSMPL